MDAARLVAQAERAIGGDPGPEAVIAEAWQAYELTEAVVRLVRGSRRAAAPPGTGGPDVADGDGRGAGAGRDAPADPVRSADGSGASHTAVMTGAEVSRATRLTTVRDPERIVPALEALLADVGQALVGLIGTAADEQAYWHCVEALDAVEEARDRLRTLGRGDPG
jgi:hypothetical protein